MRVVGRRLRIVWLSKNWNDEFGKWHIVEEYSSSELLLNSWMKMWRSSNNNKCWRGLGICLAFLCCWLLGFVWTVSWRGFSAWAREMKRLMWWKHGFICINKGDWQQSKHGRKIEGKRDQLCTMRKKKKCF
jgi:hypothetical protein